MKQIFIQKLSKQLSITLIMVLLSISFTFAQSQVKGRIIGPDGDALVGVNVSIKSTTKGTTTDANGNYRIDALDTSTLVISMIGYKTTELKVGNQTVINASLLIDE
jgi:hypothetical protein